MRTKDATRVVGRLAAAGGAIGLSLIAQDTTVDAQAVRATAEVAATTAWHGTSSLASMLAKPALLPAATPVPSVLRTTVLASPVRLVDTRQLPNHSLEPYEVLEVGFAAAGGVPAGATRVMLNLTTTNSESDGFVTAYSCDIERPPTSNLNMRTGVDVANLADVAVASGGVVCVFVQKSTDLVVDLVGWQGSALDGLLLHPMTARLLRQAVSLAPGLPTELDLPLGAVGVPSGAQALVLNVAASDKSETGVVKVFDSTQPCDASPPSTSTLNPISGRVVNAMTMVPVSTDGTICVLSTQQAVLDFDVLGWFDATGLGGIDVGPPVRLVDTRQPVGTATVGPLLRGRVFKIPVVGPEGVDAQAVRAVTLNVTAVDAATSARVRVRPCGQTIESPTFTAIQSRAVAQQLIVTVDAAGEACLLANTATNMVVDLASWWTDASP